MSRWHLVRQAMTEWRLFGVAAIVVGSLLVKFGIPLLAVIGGMSLAAGLNWASRRSRQTPSGV